MSSQTKDSIQSAAMTCSADFLTALGGAINYMDEQAERFGRMKIAMEEIGRKRLATKYHNQAASLRMMIKPIKDFLQNVNMLAPADLARNMS